MCNARSLLIVLVLVPGWGVGNGGCSRGAKAPVVLVPPVSNYVQWTLHNDT